MDCVLRTIQAAGEDITANRLNRILLDKDGCLPEIPEASDEGHWVKCPGQEEYSRCCNEFWWLLLNVGKGLWREELTYVMEMLNQWVRPESFRMWQERCALSAPMPRSTALKKRILLLWDFPPAEF